MLAGAGLDVYENEPESHAGACSTSDRVVLMPHAGSATIETRREMARMVVEDVRRVLSGEKPLRAVPPEGEPGAERASVEASQDRSDFTRLDAAADGLLRRMARGRRASLAPGPVGPDRRRAARPARSSRRRSRGRRLTLSLLDPAWRKPVQATLPELERKLAHELPEIKPKVLPEMRRSASTV